MKKLLFLFALTLSTLTYAQKGGANLSFGFGKANVYGMKTLQTETTDFFQAGLQIDGIKSNFVLGPEVRLMVGVTDFPGLTTGVVTGYDNGKFRAVGTLGMINSVEASDFLKSIEVFQGIVGGEVGYGPLFVRMDWYTNLHTYFYSYAVQAGLKLKF